MEGNEQEIAIDISKDSILDPNEVAEMVAKMLIPYESTFNKGERYSLDNGCYQIQQKPAAL
jgi:hypothetical protein